MEPEEVPERSHVSVHSKLFQLCAVVISFATICCRQEITRHKKSLKQVLEITCWITRDGARVVTWRSSDVYRRRRHMSVLIVDQHLSSTNRLRHSSTARLPLLPCSAWCPLLHIQICWPLATGIGIDKVGSVPTTTLNVTWAVPLIGRMCISTTHSSLCNWLHLPTQFQKYALFMALCNRPQHCIAEDWLRCHV